MTDETTRARADEKWPAYADTVLELAGPPPLRLDLRRPISDAERVALRALGLDAPFAVLTAENPEGENAEDEESPGKEEREARLNARRISRLERRLEEGGVRFALVDGVAPDGSYREHCVAALLARREAVALAAELRQLALFWYDGRDFWLLPALADAAPERLPREERHQTEKIPK